LLLLCIFERMIEVLKPLLKVTAVQNGGASYVQDLVMAVAADRRLRELYHTALAPAGCGPIPAVARSGSGSEDVVYELLTRFEESCVLAAWKQFRDGVLDQEALLHAGDHKGADLEVVPRFGGGTPRHSSPQAGGGEGRGGTRGVQSVGSDRHGG